jgi:hypothetical protein
MKAVLFDAREDGGYDFIECPLCGKPNEDFYTLHPDDDEEYGLLERKLGDGSNWFVCVDCLEEAEGLFGVDIETAAAEEMVEIGDRFFRKTWRKIPKPVRRMMEAAENARCPKCRGPMDELDTERFPAPSSFFLPLKSVTLTCTRCKERLHIESEAGKPIGALVIGTISGWDKNLLRIKPELGSSPEWWTDGTPNSDFKELIRLSGEGELVVNHDLDPGVLKAYNWLNEVIEVLIINNKAVRVAA